jgi:hypothetical protein
MLAVLSDLSLLAIAVLLPVAVIAALVAIIVSRRTTADAPTQPGQYGVPAQLDRNDFTDPETPWLVVVFSSASCDACAGMLKKAMALASDDVAVQEVEFSDDRSLHERYDIEAVPMLLIADADGVVRGSFIGTPSAADLWAAVAALRAPSAAAEDADVEDSVVAVPLPPAPPPPPPPPVEVDADVEG